MNWELVVVVSIWHRDRFDDRSLVQARPDAEGVFSAGLNNPNSRQEMAQALSECVQQCEKFLRRRGASLVTHTVVTVYSLEVGCNASLSTR